MSANNALHIAVLPGDGIGPEVMAPALEVLRKIDQNIDPIPTNQLRHTLVAQPDNAPPMLGSRPALRRDRILAHHI